LFTADAPGDGIAEVFAGGEGILNSESGSATFASILVKVVFDEAPGLRGEPDSIENGKYTPFTFL
jgi:hypothetical protein